MTTVNLETPERWLVDSSNGSRYIAFTEADARRIARDWAQPGCWSVTTTFVACTPAVYSWPVNAAL